MKIFAISDLHLSSDGSKPMDKFGEQWDDHASRTAANWDAVVGDEDLVIVVGDSSWAMRFEDAAADMDWVAARKGSKLLVRGNHDYWWKREATNRMRKLMPPSISLLQGEGMCLDTFGIAGTRGWRVEAEFGEPSNPKAYARELSYLQRALTQIEEAQFKIAALHYPPFEPDLTRNEFDHLLRKHQVHLVIYGHIHGSDYIDGRVDGMEYRLVAIDHTGFTPVLIAQIT